MDDSFSYVESPMSATKMTQYTKMSHLFADPDQSESSFFTGPNYAKNIKNIKTMQYIFTLVRISYSTPL